MSLQLITQPAVEPVSVVDMMGQLGMSAPTDDALDSQLEAQIRGLTMAARRQCENFTRRAFITQRWKYTLDHFPYSDGRYDLPRAYDIPLPLPNFQGLDAFTYIDPGATVQDMLAADSWGFQVGQSPCGRQPTRSVSPIPAATARPSRPRCRPTPPS
jgi:hypothetical protein